MKVPAALPSPLSPRFSSNKSTDIFIAETSLWLGLALRNSAHPQEQIQSTQQCPKNSQNLSSALRFLSPMEVPVALPSPLSPISYLNKSSENFIAEMSAPDLHPQEQIRSTQECITSSQKLSSSLPPLLSLISDGGTSRITESTIGIILLNKHPRNFITEMSFWLGIALANSVHPQGAQHCHTRVPYEYHTSVSRSAKGSQFTL